MMIRRFALAIILGIFAFLPAINGQLTLNASEETGSAGGTVDVDFTVANFNAITVMEFGVDYDTLVMRFESLTFVTSDLTGFDSSSIGVPGDDPNLNISEGMLTCSYFEGSAGQFLPEGAILFTARFNLIGEPCDSTLLAFKSGAIYSDESFNTLAMTTNDGKVNIDGTDCSGTTGGGTDLTQTATHETVGVGGNVCVPITVRNFNSVVPGAGGVGAGLGDVTWDPNIISFTGSQNVGLPTMFNLTTNNAANGMIRFVWFSNSGLGISLPENTILFELCFDAVGDLGDVSPVNLVDWEWTDATDESNVIPDVEIDGSVTIVGQPVEQFMIAASDETADVGEEVCVDLIVENFEDVLGLEYRIGWDPTVLSFPGIMDGIQNENLPALDSDNFSYVAPNSFFTMSWNADPQTLQDGTSIYQVCFDVIGDCGSSSDVSILPNGAASSIIVSVVSGGTSSNLPASSISTANGSVTVECAAVCEVINIVGACPGQASGSITVNVPASNTYSWTNAAGQVVSNMSNLLGVEPGIYSLAVTSGGSPVCNITNVTIPELPAPTITGNITNAGCTLGAINAAVTNVTGQLTFSWIPDSLGQTLNPMNLHPGTYTLTATDNGGCVASREFDVANLVDPLVANPTSTNASCFEDVDGTIDLNISGGCAPYNVTWMPAGPSGSNPTTLGAGTYTATIQDAQGSSITTAAITITAPDQITLMSQNVVNSSGADGSVSIALSGGTQPYMYNWQPGPLPNAPMVGSLAPGNYSVTVTDGNGCTASFGPFTVDPTSSVTTVTATVPSDFNGFDVACFGDTTGVISVNVNTQDLPGVLRLTGTQTDETVAVSVSGSTTFTRIRAGEYTATYTDPNGVTFTSGTIMVTQPSRIEIGVESGCESNNQQDGFIDLVVDNAVGSLTVEWGDPTLSGLSVDNLEEGMYTVMVTDENGCEAMSMISIEPCSTPMNGCYLFPKIITPNADGANDIFAADCLRDFPAELTVFNRWGEQVFNMTEYDGSWAGTNQNGTNLIEGGYMWVLDINFGEGRRELMRGTVTVLRD